MGLRDRLRLLVRPPAGAGRSEGSARPAPVPPLAPSSVRRQEDARTAQEFRANLQEYTLPTRVTTIPPGNEVLEVRPGEMAGVRARLPKRETVLRDPIVIVSREDGGAWASAVAERLCALGEIRVSWLDSGSPT